MPIRRFLKGRKEELEHLEHTVFEEEVKQLAKEFDIEVEEVQSIPPLEKDLTKTAMHLYPAEILLLSQATNFTVGQLEFPKLWREQYGFLHVPTSLLNLVSRGFLTVASMRSTLENQTIASLKQGLKTLKLPLGGKKDDLVKRLLSEVEDEVLEKVFLNRAYSLTSSGIRALDEAMYIPYLIKRPVYGLNIWNLHRLVMQNPHKSYRDLIFSHMETMVQTCMAQKDFTNLRDTCYRMYNFQMEENKQKKALAYLAHTVYIDLSGAHAVADALERFVAEKYFFPYESSVLKVSVGILSAIKSAQENLHLSEEMLNAVLIQFFRQISLPFHLFTQEECAAVIILELRGDKERLTKAYELAQQRFQSVL